MSIDSEILPVTDLDLQKIYVLEETNKLLDWVMTRGLISNKYVCCKCGKNMQLKERKDVTDGYEWRCAKSDHDVKRCLRKGSWFEWSRLSLCHVMLVTYMWCTECSNAMIMSELDLTDKTVVKMKRFCREMCFDLLVLENEKLGGEGKVVELDESKFIKAKFNREKGFEGRFVIRGIERGSFKCFLCVMKIRSPNELLKVIKKYILPGTTVVSDCWNSYDCLNNEDYKQLAANSSLQFKSLENTYHTHLKQGSWASIKREIRGSCGKEECSTYLYEYLWRRRHNGENIVQVFFEGIKKIYKPKARD